MVVVKKKQPKPSSAEKCLKNWTLLVSIIVLLIVLSWGTCLLGAIAFFKPSQMQQQQQQQLETTTTTTIDRQQRQQQQQFLQQARSKSNEQKDSISPPTLLLQSSKQSSLSSSKIITTTTATISSCPVTSISSLSEMERHPIEDGIRYMVTPPNDTGGNLTLVCCSTTKGYMSLLIHSNWAPIGVAHFLYLVRTKYFDSIVPLFKCTDACQFGFSGNPNITKQYYNDIRTNPQKQQRLEQQQQDIATTKTDRYLTSQQLSPTPPYPLPLKDDYNWLPPGKEFRQNSQGVKRYPAGFLTYAGAGPNSRSIQFVLTLQPNPFMGGGSPWEVPLGELVGAESFHTISKIYTGYGNKKAPSQPIMRKEGYSERVQREWPLMDLILGCSIVDELNS